MHTFSLFFCFGFGSASWQNQWKLALLPLFLGKNGAKINEIKMSSNVDVNFDKGQKTEEGKEAEITKVTVTGCFLSIFSEM